MELNVLKTKKKTYAELFLHKLKQVHEKSIIHKKKLIQTSVNKKHVYISSQHHLFYTARLQRQVALPDGGAESDLRCLFFCSCSCYYVFVVVVVSFDDFHGFSFYKIVVDILVFTSG